MMNSRFRLAWCVIALIALVPARAERPNRQDPADDPEERAEHLEMGRRTFNDNCQICHGPEMIVQQRLTPTQWKAEVDKMLSWGAPVPPEEVDRLLDYLNATYPVGAKPLEPTLVDGREATRSYRAQPPAKPEPAQVDRGGPLYVQHCATCHGPDARGGDLGQNLVLNRVLLDPAACLVVVRDGRRRMPGFALVLGDREAQDILAWLRTRPLDASSK